MEEISPVVIYPGLLGIAIFDPNENLERPVFI